MNIFKREGAPLGTETAKSFESDPVAASGNVAASEAVSKVEAAVEGRRGRPKGSSSGTGGYVKKADRLANEQRDEAAQKINAELSKLFAPEQWEGIVRAPADLRLALTGRDYWNLSDKDVKTLASSAATTAQYYLLADPKIIAVILLLFNVATIYGSRIALDVQANRKKDKDK